MTWSFPICGTVNQDYRRKCTARDCRHPGGPPSAWDNRRVRGTAAARARRRLRPVDDGRVPIVPSRTSRGEVIATVAVAPSALGDVEAVAVAVLQGSWLSERLSGISSRRSATGCVAATLSARRRWRSTMRVQPRPRSKMRALRILRRRAAASRMWVMTGFFSDSVPQVYQGPPESGDRGKGKGGHQARGVCRRRRWI